MHHIKLAPLIAFAVIAIASACSATKRGPETYRHDTQQVLETQTPAVKSCYDEVLKTDPKIKGTITVRFVVEKQTGMFSKAMIDPTKSSAPESLVLCVLNAINGLKLAPPDANEGQATFVYQLRPTTPPT